jgi:hypothetical protein
LGAEKRRDRVGSACSGRLQLQYLLQRPLVAAADQFEGLRMISPWNLVCQLRLIIPKLQASEVGLLRQGQIFADLSGPSKKLLIE